MSRNATALFAVLSNRMTRLPARVRAEENGQTMTEYALITALIALVVVPALTLVGNPAIVAFYTELGNAIP